MAKKKVQVVIFDSSSSSPKVLLLKTNPARGGFWQNVTGSVDEGETCFKAANRELTEETGISTSKILDLDLNFSFRDKEDREVIEQVYLAILEQTPQKILLDPREHETYEWKAIEAIEKKDYKYLSNYQAFLKAKVKLR